jgi:hypothetical protein
MALLAVLSASAGAIHLAMAPAHFAEWTGYGAAFVCAGWLQLGLAVAFVIRPSRAVLVVSCLTNTAFIGAWLVTRVWGWPIGPEAGVAEAAAFVDLACVALQAALVIAGAVLLTRPRLGDRLDQRALVALSVIPVGVLVLATAAIASPSASHHDHDHEAVATGSAAPTGAPDHDHGNGAMDHSNGAMDHAIAPGTVTVDDKGLGMLHNGHHAKMTYTKQSPEDQAQVDHFLDISRDVAKKYPTLASAKAAGATHAGPYAPGLGIHYTLISGDSFNPDGVVDDTDMAHPLTLIYDSPLDDAHIAGFMYYSVAKDQPQGFPGTNDYWHFHTDVCSVTNSKGDVADVSAEGSMNEDQCTQLGGKMMKQTQWMVHVWSVPGYEVSEQDGGVFAEVNPKLKCPDGTYYTRTDIHDLIEHAQNACRSDFPGTQPGV